MKTSSSLFVHLFWILALAALLCPACAHRDFTTTDSSSPTLEELNNATYSGLEAAEGPVALADGRWEGRPFVSGGASRPVVTLVQDLVLRGDLDGDGREEAVVLLTENSGGSGTYLSLATAARTARGVRTTTAALVGDRVQVRDARIEGRRVILDLVQAGPGDAAGRPGELITRGWELSGAGLREVEVPSPAARLSPAVLEGTSWVLRSWDMGQPAPSDPVVTIGFHDGQVSGTGGCNRWFASLTAGNLPGEISLGMPGSTRMACTPERMEVEARFLAQLQGVNRFGFMNGNLALSYEHDGAGGIMILERQPPLP